MVEIVYESKGKMIRFKVDATMVLVILEVAKWIIKTWDTSFLSSLTL